jgi:hypothetical protein
MLRVIGLDDAGLTFTFEDFLVFGYDGRIFAVGGEDDMWDFDGFRVDGLELARGLSILVPLRVEWGQEGLPGVHLTSGFEDCVGTRCKSREL